MKTASTVSSLATKKPVAKPPTRKGAGGALKTEVAPNKSSSMSGSKAGLRTVKKKASKASLLDRLLDTQRTLQRRVERPIVCSKPLLTQDGEGIIWPHTINLIQGQTGTHKSRVAELICSALITEGELRGDSLGLALGSSATCPYAVCYVDTERNQQEQFVQAIQTMKKRAGYEPGDHPAHFKYASLLDIPRTERLETLRQYLEHLRGQMAGHLVIILDQLADCVTDFNDPKESLLLTDLLNVMVNQQDVTFLCIIHENPGGSKARGHLGTECANKASTVLQVGFIKSASGTPSDVIQMKYIKRRSGSPNLTFRVQYDAEKGELVRAEKDVVKAALDNRKIAAIPSEVITALSTVLIKPMKVTDLKAELIAKVGGSDKTLGSRLKVLITEQTTVPDADGVLCTLMQEKKGTSLLCWLQPVS